MRHTEYLRNTTLCSVVRRFPFADDSVPGNLRGNFRGYRDPLTCFELNKEGFYKDVKRIKDLIDLDSYLYQRLLHTKALRDLFPKEEGYKGFPDPASYVRAHPDLMKKTRMYIREHHPGVADALDDWRQWDEVIPRNRGMIKRRIMALLKRRNNPPVAQPPKKPRTSARPLDSILQAEVQAIIVGSYALYHGSIDEAAKHMPQYPRELILDYWGIAKLRPR